GYSRWVENPEMPVKFRYDTLNDSENHPLIRSKVTARSWLYCSSPGNPGDGLTEFYLLVNSG
ncbi:MAG: hypothetical protein WA987_08265, partial [Cellvibrio sp.]